VDPLSFTRTDTSLAKDARNRPRSIHFLYLEILSVNILLVKIALNDLYIVIIFIWRTTLLST
jgi:hypothetical protein